MEGGGWGRCSRCHIVESGEGGGGGGGVIVTSPCAAGEGAGLVVRAGGDGEGPDVPVVEAWWGMCVCQSG